MKKTFCLFICLVLMLSSFASCTKKSVKEESETDKGLHFETLPPDTPPEKEKEPPEIELPDVPSVIYTTDYTDRLNRIGTEKELMQLDVTGETVYSWYVDAALDDTVELLCEKLEITEEEAKDMLYTDALQIYIAQDTQVQEIMDGYFADPSNFPGAYNYYAPEAAMVITDPETGDILGLIGKRTEKKDNETLCYATEAKRSPGSSIKPVSVYGPALEYKVINYCSIYHDSPYTGEWPSNYPEGYRGNTQIYDAVCRSVNTVAVKVLNDLGLQRSYEFMHDKLDMESILYSETTENGRVLSDMNLGSMGLGGLTYGLTVRELTGAYQIFANEGRFSGTRTVVKILDRHGNEIINNVREAEYVISPENASIMTIMLQNVVKSGTANTITLDDKVAVAGKTGTTSWFHDKWFVGYTPYYVGGVWFGYTPRQNIDDLLGDGPYPVNIWEDIMELIHEAKVFDREDFQKDFTVDDGVENTSLCRESGERATENCYNKATGYYATASIPETYCSVHGSKE
ncbi:MAG: hypothetical protein E7591_01900 [Ruminococcaceae bacterium]|nr:hypothetical protein [Oscillospiraceae bacterium]